MRTRNIPVIALIASKTAAQNPKAGGTFLNTKGCVSETGQPWYTDKSTIPTCENDAAPVVTVECVQLKADQTKPDGGNAGGNINPQGPDYTGGSTEGNFPKGDLHAGGGAGGIVNPQGPGTTGCDSGG